MMTALTLASLCLSASACLADAGSRRTDEAIALVELRDTDGEAAAGGLGAGRLESITIAPDGRARLVPGPARDAVEGGARLREGCSAAGGYVAHGPSGRMLVLVAFDCVVEAGSLVYWVSPGHAPLELDRVPFGLRRPLVLGDSVIVTASGFAGCLDWRTGRWSWRREDLSLRPGASFAVDSVALVGSCVELAESPLVAAQSKRKPATLHLSLASGAMAAPGECR